MGLVLLLRAGVHHEAAVGRWRRADGGLQEPVEEHAALPGVSAVEPECELVEVGLHVCGLDGALVRAQQPALEQGRDAVDGWEQFVGLEAGALDGEGLVPEEPFRGARVGRQAVGDDEAVRLDVGGQEGPQGGLLRVGNDLDAAAPVAFRVKEFYRDCDLDLAECASSRWPGLGAAEERLIDLNRAGEQVRAGGAHGDPVAVQHRPGGLIRAQ